MTGPNEPTTSPRTDPLIWLRKVRERLTATSRSVDYHIAMLCVESTEAEYRQEREAAAATPSLDSLRPSLRRAVEFAFEDAKQMRSYPAHPHLGLPFWPFEEFVDSLIEALKAEHPPVLARLDEGSATPRGRQ